jgi:hypothetical protein
MQRLVSALEMLAEVVNLGVAVVARGNAVRCTRIFDLIELQFTVLMPCLGKTGLEIPAAAAAAVVVRPVRPHVDEVLLTDHRCDDKTQVLGDRVAIGLSHQLAGILDRERDLAILVPIGIDLELALPYPFGIETNDALDLEIVGNIEFFQSDPDCKEFVPSFRIEPDLTTQVIHRLGLDPHDMLPVLPVLGEQAVVLGRPALCCVRPVRPDEMEDLP